METLLSERWEFRTCAVPLLPKHVGGDQRDDTLERFAWFGGRSKLSLRKEVAQLGLKFVPARIVRLSSRRFLDRSRWNVPEHPSTPYQMPVLDHAVVSCSMRILSLRPACARFYLFMCNVCTHLCLSLACKHILFLACLSRLARLLVLLWLVRVLEGVTYQVY